MGLTKSMHFFFPARRLPDCRGRQGVKARLSLPQGSLEAMAASAKLPVWLDSQIIPGIFRFPVITFALGKIY